ncbi:hypothetical protein P3T25_005178 [Paraburkholderia sp. GAS32]
MNQGVVLKNTFVAGFVFVVYALVFFAPSLWK